MSRVHLAPVPVLSMDGLMSIPSRCFVPSVSGDTVGEAVWGTPGAEFWGPLTPAAIPP